MMSPAMKVHRLRDRMMRGNRAAFTLIELLIVIAIIALLISILLPSLGQARKSARTVICQSGIRQLGIACSVYLDEQKDPQWFKMENPNFPGFFWQVGMVDNLKDYLSSSGQSAFECPDAKGLASVRDPANIRYLLGGRRVFTEPFPDPSGNQPVTKYTEYWFNDSPISVIRGHESGVANRKMRLIRNPAAVVWVTDALDEFPRHFGKPGNVTNPEAGSSAGKNNFFFGDMSVKSLEIGAYRPPEARDPYGAPGPFYNWGHFYPN